MRAALWVVSVLAGAGVGFAVGRWLTPVASMVHENGSAMRAADGTGFPAVTRDGAAIAPSGGGQPGSDLEPASNLRDRIRELAARRVSLRTHYEAVMFFANVALADLPDAYAVVQELPYTVNRRMLVACLFERWGELDGPAALANVAELPGHDRSSIEARVFAGWGRSDPRAAWSAAKVAIRERPGEGYRIAAPIGELARIDLTEAFHEATTLNPNTALGGCRQQIVEAAAETGRLATLVDAAMQLPTVTERQAWIEAVFQRWGGMGMDAPMQALRAISDPVLARSAMEAMIYGWSDADPRAALEFVLENPDNPLQEHSLDRLMSTAANQLRLSELREILVSAKAKGTLTEKSPEIVEIVASDQPALAFELATSISDEEKRKDGVSISMRLWAEHDFSAAAAGFERMPPGSERLRAFGAISPAAIGRAEGGTLVARWMATFWGSDRVGAVQGIVRELENLRRYGRFALRPEDAAALAQAIRDTNDLPPEVLEQARKVLQPLPAPQ